MSCMRLGCHSMRQMAGGNSRRISGEPLPRSRPMILSELPHRLFVEHVFVLFRPWLQDCYLLGFFCIPLLHPCVFPLLMAPCPARPLIGVFHPVVDSGPTARRISRLVPPRRLDSLFLTFSPLRAQDSFFFFSCVIGPYRLGPPFPRCDLPLFDPFLFFFVFRPNIYSLLHPHLTPAPCFALVPSDFLSTPFRCFALRFTFPFSPAPLIFSAPSRASRPRLFHNLHSQTSRIVLVRQVFVTIFVRFFFSQSRPFHHPASTPHSR